MTPPPPPRRRLRLLLIVVAVLLAAAFTAMTVIRFPYYTLGPGSVRPTGSLISVSGGTTYPPQAGVSFTTVSVNGRINAWQALSAWLNPEVDVVKEELILQGKSPKQTQQVNLQQMDDSKDVATKVALHELGAATMAGAQIVSVVPGSPAEKVVKAGDVVTALDGTPITSSPDLIQLVGGHKPGDTIKVTVRRDAVNAGEAAATETVEGVLAPNKDQPTAPFFGVLLTTYFDVAYNHPISIDSGQVGGPSAGLAFTLGLVDDLTPGELAGGQRVAATGTMSLDGRVGPIGGLEHKVDAVRHAGVHLFLVPKSQTPAELAKAQEHAKGEVEIVPVGSLSEALAVLQQHGGQSPGQIPATASH
jgi:PDZ domain-containing protein